MIRSGGKDFSGLYIEPMTLKQKIHTRCCDIQDEKIRSLTKTLHELVESAESDIKSSAGDKHETGRAMIQIEQENIGRQLNEAMVQKAILEKIDADSNSPEIIKGSLVKTNRGFLYLSIPLGKINLDSTVVFALSPQSPLGTKLMGLKAKATAGMNGVNYIIESVQ